MGVKPAGESAHIINIIIKCFYIVIANPKGVAISFNLMRSPRRFAPRDDFVGLRSLLRAKQGIFCVPRNDILLNAFVLVAIYVSKYEKEARCGSKKMNTSLKRVV